MSELILAGSHASRDVIDGKVVWADNLPCDPECEPEKGIHVLRSSVGREIGDVERIVPEDE